VPWILLLLLIAFAAPALAEWSYAPPPVGAVVTYSDGRVSRIDSVAGESIVLVETMDAVVEETDYRTWLVRLRVARQDRPGEILLQTAAQEALLKLWPLRTGESLAYGYEALQDGSKVLTGQAVVSYAGEETLELDVGSLRAHRLVREYTYTETTGKTFSGTQTTWHDAKTGLILQVSWEREGPLGKNSGMYTATKIELP
jgi:hypothetical protein